MNRIFNKKEGKPCSCSTGKKCSSCKKQKAIKPVVYIEEPRRLPTSIVISRCNTKQHKTEQKKAKLNKKLHAEDKKKVEKLNKLYSDEEKRLLKQRKSDEKKLKYEQQPKGAKKSLPSLRGWYKQRKALIRLMYDRRKERKDKEKVKENEALHAFEEQAKGKKAGGKKRRKLKEREATAKPLAHSKYVSAKHASKTNKTLTYRFVNFCNKLCCQCYCYFSIIFILGFLFIYFL